MFHLPSAVVGKVLVNALALSKQIGCPTKGQPGKKAKIGKVTALLEPIPSTPHHVRDISNTMPPSAFVALATKNCTKPHEHRRTIEVLIRLERNSRARATGG